MNFLFTLNAAYLEPLCMCLRSIDKISDEKNDYYIAHNSLTEINMARIAKELNNTPHKVHYITIGDEYFNGLTLLKHTTKETYYRLLCMDYLPKDVNRILYLDPDIVCINSLKQFYNMNFDGNFFSMASHMGPFMHWFNSARLKLPDTYPYFNAGVILINLKLLREYYTGDMILDYMSNTKIRLDFADQDVLNVMFYDRIKLADTLLYNLDARQFRRNKMTIDDVRRTASIIHYDGKDKPWNNDCKNPLKVFYEEVCNYEKVVSIYKRKQTTVADDNVSYYSDNNSSLLRKVQH